MLWDIAIKNIWRRKLRSILTILGIAVAIQLYLMMNGIMSDYEQDIERQVSLFAGKVFIQRPIDSVDAGEDFPSMNSSINMEIASSIMDIDGINRDISSPVLFTALSGSSSPNKPPSLIAVGIEPGHEEAFLGGIGIESGSIDLLEPNSVVLGEHAAYHYRDSDTEEPLKFGDSVVINNNEFSVVGVLKPASSLYEGVVIMPLATAQDIFNRPDSVSSVILTASSLDNIEGIKSEIAKNFSNLKSFSQEDVDENARNIIATQNVFFSLINYSVILATIMLITIVVVVSVMEQRKEIGTLRAVGASRSRIFTMVLGQSVILSMMGGILALPISVIFDNLLQFEVSISALEVFLNWLMPMGASIVIGLIASILPAWKAVHIDPLEALKYE